jgi:DNA repair protein RadC
VVLHQPLSIPARVEGPVAAEMLFARLAQEQTEVAVFAYLAADGRLLGMRHARSAHCDRLALPLRDIAADAIAFDARGVVMAHNHPSGDCTPSLADREATRQLAKALAALEVRLLDHLIVAGNRVTSFRTLGLL